MIRYLFGATACLALACTNETALTPDVSTVDPIDEDTDVVVDPWTQPGTDATTRGTEHWVAFMENLDLAWNGPPAFALVLHAESSGTATVTLPQTGLEIPVTVGSGFTEVDLPNAILYPEGSNVIGRAGLVVRSDVPVEVLALHDRVYFSEATLALPMRELGSRYRVISSVDVDNANRSSFIVAATRNDTQVTVTPSTITTAAFGAGNPIEVTLNAGETYQVHAFGDLSGSLVEADAPVAVFGGGADAAVSCGATSHAWEQLPPTRRWGTESRIVPLFRQGGDVMVVVADQDGTQVRIDCGDPIALDAGEVYTADVTDPTRVTSNVPVAVGQLAKGTNCTWTGLGDANLAIVTPEALYRDNLTLYADLRDFPSHDPGQVGYVLTRGLPGDVEPESTYVTDPIVEIEGTIRGVAFAVSQWDARTFSLGYDCIGCVEDLVEPAACP